MTATGPNGPCFGKASSRGGAVCDATAAITTLTDTVITGSTAAQTWATVGIGWYAARIGTTGSAGTAGSVCITSRIFKLES